MKIYEYIIRLFCVWLREIRFILKDEGALLFAFALPLGYPLLYSWIYNNEVVRDVPIVVVDNAHSAISREMIQKMDATPDVEVAYHAISLAEAQRFIADGKAYGVVYFPEDFDKKIGRHEQATVSVYCDMSYMLTYKAIYQTVVGVSTMTGSKVTAALNPTATKREGEISAKPLEVEEVQIFNTTGGYGNFILPAVLVLIVQQAILLCIGLRAGTEREKHFKDVTGVGSTMIGKGLAYFMIYAVMLAYTTMIVPRLFGFVMMVHLWDWFVFMTPYLMACVGFGIVGSSMIRYRENVMLTAVCTSIPFLFLSGISWPQSAIPGFWQGVGQIVPSTFAMRGFVRMSSMGARIGDVLPEFRALCILAVIYNVIALLVVYRRYKIRCLHIEKETGKYNNM